MGQRRSPLDALTRPPLDALTRPPLDALTRPPLDALTRPPQDALTRPPQDALAGTPTPAPRDSGSTERYHGLMTPNRHVAGLAEHRSSLVPLRPPGPDAAEDRSDERLSDVDEWGRSEHMRELVRRYGDPMYRYWFRVEWQGLEKIPLAGGALLVSNHAAAIPSDAPVIMHGIEKELGRPVYGLADYFFRQVPAIGTLWSRLGGVTAHPDNALRLLRDQGQLALVFPEGAKGPSKSVRERYRLRRFGRGGFVEIAMRAGVPVVPLAVVGAEESMPVLFQIPALARALGVPYWPVTINQLVLGPVLGTVIHFPAKFRIRVLDPIYFDVPPGHERYSKSRVMDEAETIRQLIQETLYEMLRDRRSVWFG